MKSKEFFPRTVKAVFQKRPNRFIVECFIQGRPVRAYLPNPGRLWELFFPGTVLYLVKHAAGNTGSTDYTVVAVEREGCPIMLHTHVNNLVARQLMEEGYIRGLERSVISKSEVKVGRSRFDFLLEQEGKEVIVEVKSCTLVGNRIAMFPDAVTARGTRHLLELSELAKEGTKSVVLFLVHWAKPDFFMPEWHTDLVMSQALLSVKDEVQVTALSVEWKQGLTIGTIREIPIPWQIVEKEAHDRGSYIVIMQLKRDRLLQAGSLGEVKFRKGYYCYVGSAKTSLTKRIERHRRVRKKLIWHVDYLRNEAKFHAVLPIRASDDLECEIATALGIFAEWEIPAFGASDCGCQSHLFGMTENPIQNRSFIKLLQHFRMDRLENLLTSADILRV